MTASRIVYHFGDQIVRRSSQKEALGQRIYVPVLLEHTAYWRPDWRAILFVGIERSMDLGKDISNTRVVGVLRSQTTEAQYWK